MLSLPKKSNLHFLQQFLIKHKRYQQNFSFVLYSLTPFSWTSGLLFSVYLDSDTPNTHIAITTLQEALLTRQLSRLQISRFWNYCLVYRLCNAEFRRLNLIMLTNTWVELSPWDWNFSTPPTPNCSGLILIHISTSSFQFSY